MSIGVGRWKLIVDEEAAKYCMKYRTIREAHFNYLQAHPEARNPKSGKAVSYQALHLGAWRWILSHLEESRKVISENYQAMNQTLSDEDWKVLIVSHARHTLSPRNFEKFLTKNGLESYRDVKQPRTADGTGG